MMTGESCCLVYLTGSRLYGCAEPDSDHDLRGIIEPTRKDYLDLTRPKERARIEGAEDVQVWSLHHWCDMFAKGSPNALEIALLPDSAVQYEDDLGRQVRRTARAALHAGFMPHLAHYAHGQHHRYERGGSDAGKRLMHAVRVLRLAVTLAETGDAPLIDPDPKLLLRIRHGAYMEGETEYRRLDDRLAHAVPVLPAHVPDAWDMELKTVALNRALEGKGAR